MATSQNGYTAAATSAGIPGGLKTITPKGAPGTQLRVRAGDVATVLQYLVDQFQARVENIDLYTKGSGDDWGHAYRPIRGAVTGLSNHASGTAVDLNATRHPLGTNPTANFTAAQILAIRHILTELDGAVAWGGNYHGRKDSMHFEIDCTLAKLRSVAAAIQAGRIHGPAAKPPVVKPPAAPLGEITIGKVVMADILAVSVKALNAARTSGDVSRDVWYVQLWLRATGAAVAADGYWGPKTQAGLDNYRRSVGFHGADALGTIGLSSLGQLRTDAHSTKPIVK